MKLLNHLTLLLVILLVTGAGLWLGFRMFGSGQPQPSFSANTIVTDLQELQRLETAVYTMEQIIEADSNADQAVWQEILFEDRLLLIANGQVIAGIDFAQLSDDAIQIFDSELELTLPAPEILVTSLNEEKTRVYDRSTGLLTRGSVDLESQARETAVDLLETAACQEGILDQANQNAAAQLEVLLSQFGFETVTVTTTAGSC